MQLNENINVKPNIVETSTEKLPKGVLCRCTYPIANLDQRNANNRIYRKAVFEKVLADKDIQFKLANRKLFGQAEHPEGIKSDLQLTSHVITKMWIDESTNTVWQEIDVLNTPAGQIVGTLLMAECMVGVSTRAEGDVKEGIDDQGKYLEVIPELYGYRTTDFTADESTFGALPKTISYNMVSAVRESFEHRGISKKLAESILDNVNDPEALKAKAEIESTKDCKCNPGFKCGTCGKCQKESKEWFIHIDGEGDWPIKYNGDNEEEAKQAYLKFANRTELPKGSKIWNRLVNEDVDSVSQDITKQEYSELCKKHKQARYGVAPMAMRLDGSVSKFKEYKDLLPEEKKSLKNYYTKKFGKSESMKINDQVKILEGAHKDKTGKIVAIREGVVSVQIADGSSVVIDTSINSINIISAKPVAIPAAPAPADQTDSGSSDLDQKVEELDKEQKESKKIKEATTKCSKCGGLILDGPDDMARAEDHAKICDCEDSDDDEVKSCPECGTPNQFGELCNRCRAELGESKLQEANGIGPMAGRDEEPKGPDGPVSNEQAVEELISFIDSAEDDDVMEIYDEYIGGEEKDIEKMAIEIKSFIRSAEQDDIDTMFVKYIRQQQTDESKKIKESDDGASRDLVDIADKIVGIVNDLEAPEGSTEQIKEILRSLSDKHWNELLDVLANKSEKEQRIYIADLLGDLDYDESDYNESKNLKESDDDFTYEMDDDIPDEIINQAADYVKDGMSYQEVVNAILDDKSFKQWFEHRYKGNEFNLRQDLESIITDMNESKVNESQDPKIIKARMGKIIDKLVAGKTLSDVDRKFYDYWNKKVSASKNKKNESKVNENDDLVSRANELDSKLMGRDGAWQDEVESAFDQAGVDNFTDLYEKDPAALEALVRSFEDRDNSESKLVFENYDSMVDFISNKIFDKLSKENKSKLAKTFGSKELTESKVGESSVPEIVMHLVKEFDAAKQNKKSKDWLDGFSYAMYIVGQYKTVESKQDQPSSLVTSRVKAARISEAIAIAERDKALEEINTLEESNKLDKQLSIELKSVVSKLSEALSDRDNDINGLSKLLETSKTENKQLSSALASITKKLANESTNYKLKLQEADNKNKTLKQEFINYLLEKVQFNLGDNSKALLESCSSISEAVGVFEHIIEAARVDALHPKLVGDISIRSVETNTKKAEIKEAIRKVKG